MLEIHSTLNAAHYCWHRWAFLHEHQSPLSYHLLLNAMFSFIMSSKVMLTSIIRTLKSQGLSQDFKNACPKQQFQKFCPSRFSYLSTSNPYIPATFNSLVCQKGQFTLQLCLRRWFGKKIFSYYTPKVKIEKSLYRNFCLSKQEVFRKLTDQNR